MKALFAAFFIYTFLLRCDDDPQAELAVCPASSCSIAATVRRPVGEGCGFVFELSDGSMIAHHIVGYCGTPPISEEQLNDPYFKVTLEEGLKVTLDYTNAPADAYQQPCADKTVRITCLTKVVTESDSR